MPHTNVAIIGGGLAGLSAAYLLRKHTGPQVNIKVFEASDRFGGRIHTLRQFDHGLYAEAGGMVFTDTEPKIAALVKEMGLETVPRPDGMQRRYYFDHHWNDGHAVNELLGLMVVEIQQLNKEFGSPSEWSTKESATLDKLDSMSIVAYCVKKSTAPEDVKPEDIRRTLSATLVGLYPDNLDDLSALAALRVVSQYANSKEMYSIKGGNDLLPKALASSLNQQQPTAFLNEPVSEVVYENGQWKINFANQTQTEFFDYVIMATPLSMLQPKNPNAVKLPDLPAERRQMLDEIPYNQSMARVYYEVAQRFWKTGVAPVDNANIVTNKPTLWVEDHTAAQAGTHGIIEAHACNAEGLNIQQAPDPQEAGQQAIASVYPQFTQHRVLKKATIVNWKDNPHQQGTYPYSLKGQRLFWGQLGKPLMIKDKVSLLFAGEYTAVDTPMSMNGAVESAHRVVEELLPAIQLAENPVAATRTVGLFAPQRVSEELSQQAENKPASLGL